MKTNPQSIEESSVSFAWAKLFSLVTSSGNDRISPITIKIRNEFGSIFEESLRIRAALDEFLVSKNEDSVHTVSNTIFPAGLWVPTQPRAQLYERYQKILPRLKNYPENRNGLYFERMVRFENHGQPGSPINQLEHVITTFRTGNHRASALQAAIFDPILDHSNQRQRGFPCLQQVSFVVDSNHALVVNAVYPLQYVIRKAYGNYVGIAKLGEFMAKEMELDFGGICCIIIIAQRDVPIKELGKMREAVANELVTTA
jgi:hypothetical protein